MSLTVSIGRNIPNSGAMTEEDWQRFSSDLVRIVRTYCGAIYFAGFGTGFYEGEEEESFTLISESPTYAIRENLERSLRRLANRYSQEAISFTDGRTHFLYATDPVNA